MHKSVSRFGPNCLDHPPGSLRRTAGKALAYVVAFAIAVSSALIPAIAANAASSGLIAVTTSTPATQSVGSTWNFDVSWSCSGVASDNCENMKIDIPIDLVNPHPGAIEDMDTWAVTVVPAAGSLAGFTSSLNKTGNKIVLTLTAANTILAGRAENFLVRVKPHPTTGDGVGFTFGAAELSSTNFPTVTSNVMTNTVTNQDLAPVVIRFVGSATIPGEPENMLTTYAIYPEIQGVWDPNAHAYSSCVFRDEQRNVSDTAIAGTVSIVQQLPPNATFVSASGGGVHDPVANTISWSGCSNLAQVPFKVKVKYPSAWVLNPVTGDYHYDVGSSWFTDILETSVTRTFTDTAGNVQSTNSSVTHDNIPEDRPAGVFAKCAIGRVAPGAGDVAVPNQCGPFRVAPTFAFSGDLALHYYDITAQKMKEADTLTVTEWMPCLSNPIPDSAPGMPSYESRENCLDPLATITHIVSYEVPDNGAQRGLGYQNLDLYMSDGSVESYTAMNPLAGLPALPTFSGGRKVIGFKMVLNPLTLDGGIRINLTTRLTPLADTSMNLHNRAVIDVEGANGWAEEGITPPGVGVVKERNTAVAFIGLSESPGSGVRTIRGSFGTWGLDPALGLPSYTTVLPAGYTIPGGNVSTVAIRDQDNALVTANYDITFIPGDDAAGTLPRILVIPRAGTPAVPDVTDSSASWPYISVTSVVEVGTGNRFGYQTVEAMTSLNGGPTQVQSCLHYNTLAPGDPRDIDNDGLATDDSNCRATGWAQFLPREAAATSVVQKFARDLGTSTWFGANQTAITPSGAAEYRIHWENAGQPTLNNIVMYDMFPRLNDTGTVAAQATQPRGSEFTPVFSGLTAPVPVGAVVEFTNSDNACRPEVNPALTACVNNWTTNTASLGGNSAVRGMKITLPGNWTGGQSIDITFSMQIPAGTQSGVPAWNSVASRANNGPGSMVAAETARTGIAMPADVIVQKSSPQAGGPVAIGDLVTYNIDVTNRLTSAVNGVRVVDNVAGILPYMEEASAPTSTSGTVTYDSATQSYVWVGDLGPEASATITITMRATAATPAAGAINRVVGTVGLVPTNCPPNSTDPECTEAVRAVEPIVSLDKFAASVAQSSLIEANTDVEWTYRVTNGGTEELENLVVTDSRGVAVLCPSATLAVGASMDCLGTGNVGTATPYENTGIVVGTGLHTGGAVTALDDWDVRIIPLVPTIDLVKDAPGVAEGSTVGAETLVDWTYTVTNTGTDTLVNLTVVDDQNVPVTCPVATLVVGDSTVCTGTGSVGFGSRYTNIATARAVGGYTATPVSDIDDWSVNVTPYTVGITLDKYAPAVTEGGTEIPGTVVDWEYLVTNNGEEPIGDIELVDDQGVAVICPATELAVGANMICAGSGSIGAGPGYTNIGTVRGITTLTDTPVTDDDPWTIQVRYPVPSIVGVKGALNAVEGEFTPAFHVVDWQYTVTNNGEEPLEDIVVTDDQGVVVTCPQDTLDVNEAMVCTGSGSIGSDDEYTNLMEVDAVGTVSGEPVDDADPWTVPLGFPPVTVGIIKDAVDVAIGDRVEKDAELTWTYTVVNTGGQPLENVIVTDDQGVVVTCPQDTLEVGESMECMGTGSVGDSESYTNVGSVTGTPRWKGDPVTAVSTWSTPISDPIPETPVVPETPLVPQPPTAGGTPLVHTGSEIPVFLFALGSLMVAAGALLVMRRKREAKEGARNEG